VLVTERPRLLFVSPRFLFPADSGGKIRTTQILRGLKGGRFRVELVAPEPLGPQRDHVGEIESCCDVATYWPARRSALAAQVRRAAAVVSSLPIPVATDRTPAGSAVIARELGKRPQVTVFDFAHAAVLAPPRLEVPSVLFTHNVETEIFARHAQVARSPWWRALWRNQLAKMRAFERAALARFDRIVAVSERDARMFREQFGAQRVAVIPTGVDLEYFRHAPSPAGETCVFTGSMDWYPNIDGIEFLLEQVWPSILRERPQAKMRVVGRTPPVALEEKARARGFDWRFTGFVDDVRPHVHAASVYLIPLRVGGGTRIKVYEAMAMGCPVVSTGLGVEGLPVIDGEHYLRADDAPSFAAAAVRLLRDRALATRLAESARRLVAERYSFTHAARVFEGVCADAAGLG
jgi:glycosyltransferase involved in cell wall biosynthesis